MHYYDLKLHMVGQRREGAIPFPEIVVLSAAAENDLTVFLLHIRRLRERRKSSDKGKKLPETCSYKQYQKSDNL